MAEKTGIAWTRSTFNPWIGCTKVGPGCDHCYAEALDKRMRFGGGEHWGSGVERLHTSFATWKEPLKWNARAARGERPWRVFCASLADVFDNEVPAQWRSELWALVARCSHLDWLIVTKRIGNVRSMVPQEWLHGFPRSVRLLITVCNQEEADRDVPKLLALPCKNGVSYEPALGPVDWLIAMSGGCDKHGYRKPLLTDRKIDWIICGGESTQGAGKSRPFDLAWARNTIAQCKAAAVPVFCKQLGSNAQEIAYPTNVGESEKARWHADGWTSIHEEASTHWRKYYRLKDRAGADPAEWPEDLRVQEFATT